MYRIEVKGAGGIVARIVQKSVSPEGVEIVTFELDYPRFVHSELMTHRMFSRNAASSRAIPIAKTIEQVNENPAMPIHWGKNQAGMQAKEEISGKDEYGNDRKRLVKARWRESARMQASFAQEFSDHGLHKQVVNRILEPFVFMKTVLTATEYKNWYWLRDHEDADPTIHELARVMNLANSQVVANKLEPGEWHTPYVDTHHGFDDQIEYSIMENDARKYVDLETALKISSSCCAQVSFRVLDDSIEKAEKIYDRLVTSKPVHASPFEHQATPIQKSTYDLYDDDFLDDCTIEINLRDNSDTWEKGITHLDRDGFLWSGNFKNWIQHRQLIPDNVVKG